MIIAEKWERTMLDIFDSFGEAMPDGRLVSPSDGKKYRLREAIALSEELGRPLTPAEMKQFEL
mgnify:CR=1 FL=1